MAIEDIYVISKKTDLTEIKEALLAANPSEDEGGEAKNRLLLTWRR